MLPGSSRASDFPAISRNWAIQEPPYLLLYKVMFRAALCGIALCNLCIGLAGENNWYALRRHALLEQIGGAVAVLRGAPGPGAYVPFRQDNNFYYLTGVDVPGAVLLLDGVQQCAILFLPPRDAGKERWEGPRLLPGPEARRDTGVDAVLEISELDAELARRLQAGRALYTPLTPYETAAASRDRLLEHAAERRDDPWDGRPSREAAFRDALVETFGTRAPIRDLAPLLDALRRVKDSREIALLREAGRVGALGLKEAMRSAKPGMYEYQLAAVAEFVFLWHGASGAAFYPIVGSGPNSCILHYHRNHRRMEAGDIVVLDFGPDCGQYVSDVTRTFPVSGRFGKDQADVYRIVLEAQKAVVAAVRPGATFEGLERAAAEVFDAYGCGRHALHAIGHHVGMAVHDVGGTGTLAAGNVIAVEPGLYMPEKNLGVRIEDTVLVTGEGCEILTGDVPKEIDAIEKLMASGRAGAGE